MKPILFDDFGRRLRGWATTSLTVVFGLQLMRVLFSSLVGYLRDAQGVHVLYLVPVAIGIFAVSFLAGSVQRLIGPKPAIWMTAGGVGFIRLVEQVSISPLLDLYLSAAGVALFLLFIPVALGIARTKGPAPHPSKDGPTLFGFAFLFGISADTAIHIGARTLDLSWQPGFFPIGMIVLLAAGLFASLLYYTSEINSEAAGDVGWGRSFALAALGPWLFLQLLVYQNVARVSALTRWETPAAGALVVLGNALGLAAAAWVTRPGSRTMGVTIAAGLLLIGSLMIAEPTGVSGVPLLLIGQILSFALVMMLFVGVGREKIRTGLARATVAFGVGQVLFVLILFVYYVAYDVYLGFRPQILLPSAALLVGMGATLANRGRLEPDRQPVHYLPAAAGLLLLFVPLALALTWDKPQVIEPVKTKSTIRVLNYNVHNGFNTVGRLDMEALANFIEDSDADVVALQEISRGWIIWGGVDMLAWLSQRLDMPYISGPTGDAQWGNAILSRFRIKKTETFPLPPENLPLRRGYIRAEINVGVGNLTLINTHLSHRSEDYAIREMQAAELLTAWNGASSTVIVGDMNAVPDSDAMRILSDAGLVNVGVEIGTHPIQTYPSNDPNRQIDYIWTSPDLRFSDWVIPQITASDHLPMAVTITLP